MLDEYVDDILDKYFEEVQIDEIHSALMTHLLVDVKLLADDFRELGRENIKQKIMDTAIEFYAKKEEMLGMELMARLERFAVLSVIDSKWKEHLREMDDLKEGIGLRAYGQKDPLVEYKGEAFHLFVQLLEDIRNEVISFAFKFFPQEEAQVQARRQIQVQRLRTTKDSSTNMVCMAAGKVLNRAKTEGQDNRSGLKKGW